MDDGVGSVNARGPAGVDVGDPAGIDVLWHTLHRDIRRRGVDVHVADDVAQETWLRIATRPPRMDRPLRPWLRVVGARVLAELLRKDRSRSARERRVARTDAEECADLARDDSRVLKLVAELPTPYREVISLRYVDGLEVEEIAERLARTQGTVRSQLKRGLDKLRARLEGNEEPEHGPRRYARALLGWLGFRRGGRTLDPVRASAALGGTLVLVGLVAWELERSAPRPGLLDAALALAPAERAQERAPQVVVTRREASSPEEEGAEADLSVPPRPAFGTVRFPDGTPVAGATVWKGSGKGYTPGSIAVTDASGRYRAEEIEFNHFLWATLPGWLPSRRTHVGTWIDGRPSDLVLGVARGFLELSLRDEDGRPQAGVEVELDCSFDHPAAVLFSNDGVLQYESELLLGKADELGRLQLPKPPLTRAILRVHMEGRVDHVELLALTEGDSELEVVLPRPAVLGGNVVDALGQPVPRASIELRTQDGMQTTKFETDPAGVFEIGLDPGPFELRVTEESTRGYRSCSARGVLERDERRISSWVLEYEGSLRGRALAGGKPVVGALVMCTGDGTSSAARARAYTDAEGRFALFGRTPGETVDLKLYSTVWDLLCARDSVRVGTEEVVLSSELDPTPRRLVLAFECPDPSLEPTVVELRSKDILSKAMVYPVDAATKTCTLEVPRHSEFQILPWVPAIGAWPVDSVDLGPGDFQRVRVPRPAQATFVVDLPPGVPADSIRGAIRVYGLKYTWVASQPGLQSIREMPFDPVTHSASARVFGGRNRWYLHGPGLTHVSGALRLQEGESVTEHVRMDPGVEAEVIVRFPAGAGQAVGPGLVVHTNAGVIHLEGAPVSVTRSEATFRVGLPADATLLLATAKGWSGWRTVRPGELTAGSGRPSFTIELRPGDPRARFAAGEEESPADEER